MKKGFFTELKKLYEELEGKRTYLVAGIIAGATFAKLIGWITEEEYQAFVGFLGAIGLYTLRSAVRKLE